MEVPIVLIFLILFALILIGVPVGFALGATVVVAIILGDMSTTFLIQKLVTSLDSFPLLAVPFFIMAGEIMQKGSMAKRLLSLSQCLVGHLRGGLAQVSILTSLFFGALSGSSPATVAAVGGIMIPSMQREGYRSGYATAVSTSAGCLGVMIPPSVPLIIYGTTAGVSVGDLFIATIIPGIIVGLALMLTAYILARRGGHGPAGPRAGKKQTLVALWASGHALMVPLIVLGGIYGGIMTPTEAGVSAVGYALLAEVLFLRSLSWVKLWDVMRSTALTTASIFLVVATATAFGQILLFNDVPNQIVAYMTGLSESPYVILFLIILILLVLGTFMDALANILILAPLFVPVVSELGMDPVHFGVVMLIGVASGFLTPPVGINLFVGCGIGNISIERLSYAVLPFLLAIIAALLVIALVPALSLFLIP